MLAEFANLLLIHMKAQSSLNKSVSHWGTFLEGLAFF